MRKMFVVDTIARSTYIPIESLAKNSEEKI